MIRQCCKCKKILGEKEPLEDKSITSGYCDQCLDEVMRETRAYHKERKIKRERNANV